MLPKKSRETVPLKLTDFSPPAVFQRPVYNSVFLDFPAFTLAKMKKFARAHCKIKHRHFTKSSMQEGAVVQP
jgi:hypothetical protein